MTMFATKKSLLNDLALLKIDKGDGIFVHASMKAVGPVVGGPRTIVEALLEAVGETGLLGMPGFSEDAYFPADIDRSRLTPEQINQVEAAVPGFDVIKSPTTDMGVIAETFRTWPGTHRSNHPTLSICLNGLNAEGYLEEHSLAWGTGEQTPWGKLRDREPMKILLIGVGWNRCSALHTAESFAEHKRTKVRRFKNGGVRGSWIETPDVADDMNRLFPAVGEAFEQTAAVLTGSLGNAYCRVCDFSGLISFARDWIDAANKQSGDRS